MTHQTVSLGKYWKLFLATLKSILKFIALLLVLVCSHTPRIFGIEHGMKLTSDTDSRPPKLNRGKSGDVKKNSEILFFPRSNPFPSREVINSLFKCYLVLIQKLHFLTTGNTNYLCSLL